MRYEARSAKIRRNTKEMADGCQYWDGEYAGENSLKGVDVIMAEDMDAFTGLYDTDGRPLYRVKDRIGFDTGKG